MCLMCCRGLQSIVLTACVTVDLVKSQKIIIKLKSVVRTALPDRRQTQHTMTGGDNDDESRQT